MMAGFIKDLAAKGTATQNVAVFPGFVNPGDVREWRHLLRHMKLKSIMFPDCSNVMDAPMTGKYQMYPEGGTTIEEIKALGSCRKVLALGRLTSDEPAAQLKRKCAVDYDLLPLPIGLADTDTFIMALANLNGGEVDAALEEERGRLLDLMLDANPYYYGKKVAVYGDPDTVLGLARFCLELGMTPSYVLTGTPGEAFVKLATALFKEYGKEEECKAFAAKDLVDLHQHIKKCAGGPLSGQFARQTDSQGRGHSAGAGGLSHSGQVRPPLPAPGGLPGGLSAGHPHCRRAHGRIRPRLRRRRHGSGYVRPQGRTPYGTQTRAGGYSPALPKGVVMSMEILEERRTSIQEKGRSCCSGDGLRCDTASVAGAVSQRACVYCGARVVLNPIGRLSHRARTHWLRQLHLGYPGQPHQWFGIVSQQLFHRPAGKRHWLFGGAEKLTRAIDEAVDHSKAQADLLYATRIVGVIGDDVEAVCRRAEERTASV